jgi:hypothetical protein
MGRIRQYGIVILVVLPVAVVVLIRALSADRFDHNARKLARIIFSHSNIIAWHKLDSVAGLPYRGSRRRGELKKNTRSPGSQVTRG